MDRILLSYLKSGNAWLIIGSGLSISCGYPSWKELAEKAINHAVQEGYQDKIADAIIFYGHSEYPKVFSEISNIIGLSVLVEYLDTVLKPKPYNPKLYDILAGWNVPVFLTTNYDDEIQNSLARKNISYKVYSNSQDHLGRLIGSTTGAIYKLHGDLKSTNGLILTNEQYSEIQNDSMWEYWRSKLLGILSLQPIIIIGFSRSDPHINTILQIARSCTVTAYPICWIGPDISLAESKDLLERYRIRVIAYDNRDNSHSNLERLLTLTNIFIPSSVQRKMSERLSDTQISENTSAPGFFIYNKLSSFTDFDERRIAVLTSAINSIVPKLGKVNTFTIQDALLLTGWPTDVLIPELLIDSIAEKAISIELLKRVGNKYQLGAKAERYYRSCLDSYTHLRERFISSVELRIKRYFPSVGDTRASELAYDIEHALISFFWENGLTLATTMYSQGLNRSALPDSIVTSISNVSATYPTTLDRQVFLDTSIRIFVESSASEKEYLGRIAQGYFAFHALGAFGESSKQIYQEAKSTIWLIDSSAQIHGLANGSSLFRSFHDCFVNFKLLGVRLFTTYQLFHETFEHLIFANEEIAKYSPDHPYIYSAAQGESPYTKANVFLEGFIAWSGAGNTRNWNLYLKTIIGNDQLNEANVKKALLNIGIEVVELENWPGYSSEIQGEKTDQIDRIIEKMNEYGYFKSDDLIEDRETFLYNKASPEAEALIIVDKEREGVFNILCPTSAKKPAWFISDTSILNTINRSRKMTWQTSAFLRFALTVFPQSSNELYRSTFDSFLMDLSQAGVSLIEDEVIEKVFGDVIDQSTISLEEELSRYHENIENKFAEPEKNVLERISKVYRPIVAIQLVNQLRETQEETQKTVATLRKEVSVVKKEKLALEKYRNRMLRKQAESKRNKRKKRGKKK